MSSRFRGYASQTDECRDDRSPAYLIDNTREFLAVSQKRSNRGRQKRRYVANLKARLIVNGDRIFIELIARLRSQRENLTDSKSVRDMPAIRTVIVWKLHSGDLSEHIGISGVLKVCNRIVNSDFDRSLIQIRRPAVPWKW